MNLPALHLSGFFVPGGNGLPDLYVHADDPSDWVTMQIAARQPGGGNYPTAKDVAETTAVGATASATPDFLKRIIDGIFSKFPNPKDYFKGLAVAGFLVLLAVGLIVLGAYQLVKD